MYAIRSYYELRSGTESVPLIAGISAAVEEKSATFSKRFDYVTGLKQYLIDGVKDKNDIFVISPENSLPYIISIAVKGIKSEIMLHYLEGKGIYVSSGSACSKGEKSKVLKAFNVSDKLIDSVIRISFSDENTKEEIDSLIRNNFV